MSNFDQGRAICSDTRHLEGVVFALHQEIGDAERVHPRDLLAARLVLDDVYRALGECRAMLDDRIGELMDGHRVTFDGFGVATRHRKKSRTRWDKDALLSAVLDSRLVDSRTGEVADESPLDKVLKVWNLPAPRVTALKARGIDADEFCHVEEREGWTIEVTASDDVAAGLIAKAKS